MTKSDEIRSRLRRFAKSSSSSECHAIVDCILDGMMDCSENDVQDSVNSMIDEFIDQAESLKEELC